MANKKIRIRLKAYEHRTLDTAALQNRRISYSYRCTSCGSIHFQLSVASTQLFVRLTNTKTLANSRNAYTNVLIDIISPTQTVDSVDEIGSSKWCNVEIKL